MKRTAFILAIIGILSLLGGCTDLNPDPKWPGDLYYYYFNQRIFLTERKDLITVCFVDAASRRQFVRDMPSTLQFWNRRQNAGLDYAQWNEEDNYTTTIFLQSTRKKIPASQMKELRYRTDVQYVTYMLENERGDIVGVTNEFAVKLRNAEDYQKLETMARGYRCEVFVRPYSLTNVYYLRIPKSSDLGPVRTANRFQESRLFEFAEPNFISFMDDWF